MELTMAQWELLQVQSVIVEQKVVDPHSGDTDFISANQYVIAENDNFFE